MAYRRGPASIREAYEDHFHVVDAREVTVHRVVNIIEKRSHMPEMEYDRGFHEDQYGGPRHYHNERDFHSDSLYPHTDRYYEDDPNYSNYHRSSSAPRNDASYYARDDLRHQLGSRSRSRARPHYRSRGRGSGPPQRDDRKDYRSSPPVGVKRDRSPVRKEAQPPVRSGSSTSSRSFSPDKDKGHAHEQTQKKHKPNVQTSQTPSSAVEEPPQSSASSKEKTPASVAETEEVVVVAASVEPKPTPEEDFKARRSEAIKAKALEIEKHYRQDCETFRTVVKMLVDKEPCLEKMLQAPLDANLSEIKQRCLDSLKHFVKELDETVSGGGDEPSHDTPYSSSTTHVQTEEDSPQLYSTSATSTDGKEEGRKQAGNTGDCATGPAENQREGNQIGNTGDAVPAPEIYMPVRQENLATRGPEDSHSEPMELLTKNLIPQQDPVESFSKRLQLYNQHGVKFSNICLSNPKAWQDITYARPGWIPDLLPFLKPGDGYWELRANSTIVSSSKPAYSKGQTRVACGVTCYNHVEGPWCEVQSHNGTRICILAAPPPTPQIPPLMGMELP